MIAKNFDPSRRNAPAPFPGKQAKKPKLYTCANRACRTKFARTRPMQTVCCWQCAQIVAEQKTAKDRAKREQEERNKTRAQLLQMKPRKWWLAKAKTAFHLYVRIRDEGKTCISCDSILLRKGRVGGDYDAGHFRSVGSAKHLEFEHNNVHGQCKHCNDRLSGNRDGYESGLINRFGIDFVEALKNDNEPRHLAIEDFREIEAHYKALTKQLLKDSGEQ